MDAPIPDKLSFKIGEVAELVGVKPHVLRFWEGEFTRVRPTKGKNGHRLYTRTDVERLRQIRALLHDRGFTIAGARALLKKGEAAIEAAVQGQTDDAAAALVDLQKRLAETTEALDKAKAQAQAMRRVAERAREEVDFWRATAQKAEGKLATLVVAVRAEAAGLSDE